MISIELNNGTTVQTETGDLSFWMQRMSTTDIQIIREKITGRNIAINPQSIVAVIDEES